MKTVVIHCSDTETGTAEAIHDYHIKHNGWDGIGYHYVIDRDGNIINGRPEYWTGAHVKGHNVGTLGICLIGVNTFTIDQLNSLKDLIDDIHIRYEYIDIKGHYELDTKKTCPNIDMKKLRDFLNTGKLYLSV